MQIVHNQIQAARTDDGSAPADTCSPARARGRSRLPAKPAPVEQALLNEFPDISRPGSTANQPSIRAFQRTGNDLRRALQVARAGFGES